MAHDRGADWNGPGYRSLEHPVVGLQWFRATLLILVMISTYLNVPLVSGDRLLVPSYPTVALLPLLFLAIRKDLTATDIVFLLKITFVLLLTIALSPGYDHLNEKFLSLIQCCLALTVTVMTVLLMQQLRPEMLEGALLVLWVLIIVGCLLEIAGVTREISDAFRTWAYEETYHLYAGFDRDLRLVGWERPKLFSTEPSHVSTIFIVAVNSWLMLRVTKTKIFATLAATATMLIIMGSPMIVVSAAITLAILVWNRGAGVASKAAMVIAALLVGLVFVVFFAEETTSNVTTRIESIGDETLEENPEPSSENLRVVYPFLTLYEVWERWPVFGAGIGGTEVLMERIIFQGLNAKFVGGTNGLAQAGIYLGLVGVALFTWFLIKQASHSGVARIGLLLVIIALLAQLQGGIDSFRFWGFIAPMWGVLAVADTRAIESTS